MNAVPDIKDPSPGTALTVTEKARIALKSEQTEKDFRALVDQSRSIKEITNADGYKQCHSARMALVRARTTLTKWDKEVREELIATNKAIVAECKRLTEIVQPEEKRLQDIQEAWDAKIAAEKRAKEQAERQRVAAITQRIDEIREIPDGVIGNSSEVIAKCIEMAKAMVIDDTFAEFKSQAEGAKATVIVRLEKLLTVTIASESEARRLAAEREAQEVERQRLARERAEQEAAAAKERERLAEEERQATLRRQAEEREQQARLQRQREEEERQAAERRRVLDEEERAAAQRREAEEARLAAERAELERQQEALCVQQEAVAKPSDPVEATAQEDVTLVVAEGPARPSDAEIIDAVAEAFEVSAEVAAGWIGEMGICRGE